MLWRALGDVQDGHYLDIGAQDPVEFSVSMAFYERGWRGIHVEPNLDYAEKLRQARPGDAVLEVALGKKSGVIEFFDIEGTGLSTLQPQIADRHKLAGLGVVSRLVPMLTLDEVLARFHDEPLHWLKIDVEGAEKLVLEGWQKASVRPWVVVVESTLPMNPMERDQRIKPRENHSEWESLLTSKGYLFAYFDGLNRFYVAEEHAELLEAFQYPPCVFDDFKLVGTQGPCHHLTVRAAELENQAREIDARARFLDSENERRELALIDHRHALGELRQQIDLEVAESVRLRSEYARLTEQASANEAKLRGECARQVAQASANEAWVRAECARQAEQALANEAKLREECARQVEQASANEARLRAEQSEAYAERDRWRVVAEDSEARFGAILRSRSWRVTRPVRGVHRLLRGEYALGRRSFRATLRQLKHLLRPLLLALMGTVLARPVLRAWFVRQTNRWPLMHRRLRVIALNAKLVDETDPMTTPSSHAEEHQSPNGGGLNLDATPLRVRKIYAHLQQVQRSAGGRD